MCCAKRYVPTCFFFDLFCFLFILRLVFEELAHFFENKIADVSSVWTPAPTCTLDTSCPWMFTHLLCFSSVPQHPFTNMTVSLISEELDSFVNFCCGGSRPASAASFNRLPSDTDLCALNNPEYSWFSDSLLAIPRRFERSFDLSSSWRVSLLLFAKPFQIALYSRLANTAFSFSNKSIEVWHAASPSYKCKDKIRMKNMKLSRLHLHFM